MKRFQANGKINYVDLNNRLVGLDNIQDCCEDFGDGVFKHIPTHTTDSSEDNIDLEPYSFVDETPIDCLPNHGEGGGGLAWRITAENQQELWVVIWNHHNGWYSHGFEAFTGNGNL